MKKKGGGGGSNKKHLLQTQKERIFLYFGSNLIVGVGEWNMIIPLANYLKATRCIHILSALQFLIRSR